MLVISVYVILNIERVSDMSVNVFEEWEIKALEDSGYVKSVTDKVVVFNAEFRQKYFEMRTKGYRPEEAVKELGINPKILGYKRITSMDWRIMQQGRLGEGFFDYKLKPSPEFDESGRSDRNRIQRLETELAYTKQELEFIKKILKAAGEFKE